MTDRPALENLDAIPQPAPWSQLEAHAFNAVQPALNKAGAWLPLSVRRAVARAVLAAVQPRLAGHYQHAVDAAVAVEQRAKQAEAAIRRAHHIADLIAAGAPWTANHDTTAARLREALDGPAHDAGPTVAEAAAQDRRWWNSKKAGEQ